MSEQIMSSEERLYRAFEEHVNPETFSFGGECLTIQTADAMGATMGDPSAYLADRFDVDLDRVFAIYQSWIKTPREHWRDLPYCLALAREILGLPPLTDEAPDASEQPVMV